MYVGGVRMDEYGEFIHDDSEDGADEAFTHTVTDEPELPGLTDEAKRLLEVAREELEGRGDSPLLLCRSLFRAS